MVCWCVCTAWARDNHDNARFLNANGDHKLYKAALVYSLYSEGIPIVYYGSEQVQRSIHHNM